MKKRAPWYKDLQILTYLGGGILAVGTIGTSIVVLSRYITLPERVEAGEKTAQAQQKEIDQLTAIQETWQKIYQQQQASNAPPATNRPSPPSATRVWTEEDQDVNTYCTNGKRSWWPDDYGRCE